MAQRRKADKPRDATTPHGSTAAESVRNLLKKNPRYSKRINYDALKDLFTHEAPGKALDELKDGALYTIDDKSDGDGALGAGAETDGDGGDEDAEGDEEGSEKGEAYAEWDAYEQEV